MTNIVGPDVSFYQDSNATPQKIDFTKMKSSGAEFVIIRAGQNLWADPDFKDYWRESKGILPRGSYFYYDNRIDPKKQAETYFGQFWTDFGELPMFCDFEDATNVGPYKGWKHWYTFIERLKVLVPNKEIGIYTAYYYWLENTSHVGISSASTEYFKQFPLWVANYGVTSPLVPKPWTDWTFWQYTDKGDGTLYGVESKNIDMNYFNGDISKFNQRFGLSGNVPEPTPIPIPPIGENKMYDVISTIYNMTLRSDHNTGAVGSDYIPKNTVMKADEIWTAPIDLWKTINGVQVKINSAGDKWAHVVSVNGVAKTAWTAVVHNGLKYCDVTVASEPSPTPIPMPIPVEDEIVSGVLTYASGKTVKMVVV